MTEESKGKGKGQEVEFYEYPEEEIEGVPETEEALEELKFRQQVNDLCLGLAKTLVAKNKDYGGSAQRIPLFLPNLHPKFAMLIRLNDKVNRLHALLNNYQGINLSAVKDTLLDMAGYSILLLTEIEREEDF